MKFIPKFFFIIIYITLQIHTASAQEIMPPPGKGDCLLDFFGKMGDDEGFQKFLDYQSGNDDDRVIRSGYDIAVPISGFYAITNKRGQIRQMMFANGYKTSGMNLEVFQDTLPFGLHTGFTLLKVAQTLGRPINIKETKQGLRYFYYYDGIKVEILFKSRRETNNAGIRYIQLSLHQETKMYEGMRTQQCPGVPKREPIQKNLMDSILDAEEELLATRAYMNHLFLSNVLNVRDRYELFVGDKIRYQLRESNELKSGKLRSVSSKRIIVELDTMRPQALQKIIPNVPNSNLMIYSGLAAVAGGAFLVVNSFSGNNSSALEANIKFGVGLMAIPTGIYLFKKGRRYRSVNEIDFDKNWRMEIRTIR